MPKLSTFVTLSPVTNFAQWLKRERAEEKSAALTNTDKMMLATLDQADWWRNEEIAVQAAGSGHARGRVVLFCAHVTSADCRSTR